MFSQEILKGTLKPMIIKLIMEEGKMYGYQITQQVKKLSCEQIALTEGALYPALHKLVEDGFLVVESEQVGNRERKYYSLSEIGRQTAAAKLEEIRESIRVLVRIFDLKPLVYDIK
ncbi:MAG: PadR family transcriptional regulator [Tannerellaceae bacterium]|nr:PadR family transcriptional regulator [Tannerellaceae bacterium]